MMLKSGLPLTALPVMQRLWILRCQVPAGRKLVEPHCDNMF